jgi:hypothetical protein
VAISTVSVSGVSNPDTAIFPEHEIDDVGPVVCYVRSHEPVEIARRECSLAAVDKRAGHAAGTRSNDREELTLGSLQIAETEESRLICQRGVVPLAKPLRRALAFGGIMER